MLKIALIFFFIKCFVSLQTESVTFFFSYNKFLFLQVLASLSASLFFCLRKKNLPTLILISNFSLVKKNLNSLDDLTLNSVFLIHPFFISLIFLYLFLKTISSSRTFFKEALFIFFLGVFWSLQEVFWSGLWDWNVLEFCNLIVLLLLFKGNHFGKNNLHWANTSLLVVLITVTLNSFLNNNSVHSFSKAPNNNFSKNFLILFFFYNKFKSFLFFFAFASLGFSIGQAVSFFYINKIVFVASILLILIFNIRHNFFLLTVNPLLSLCVFSNFSFYKNNSHFITKLLTLPLYYFFVMQNCRINVQFPKQVFIGLNSTFTDFFQRKDEPFFNLNNLVRVYFLK